MRLTYLGENKPAVFLVAEQLKRQQTEGRLDWDKTWVFVPTQESALRLKQVLLQSSEGGALLPPKIWTPEAFLQSLHTGEHKGAFLSWGLLVTWASVILEEDYPNALVLLPPAQKTWSWALGLAETCLNVRRVLGQEAKTLRERFSVAQLDAKERARWELLLDWEKKVEGKWSAWGLKDPLEAEIAWATHPSCGAEGETVIFACVPDPLPLVMQGMQALAQKGDIKLEIWVQAREGGFVFDDWGRPKPLDEQQEVILPYKEAQFELSGDSLGMAEKVRDFFVRQGSGAEESAVGVCDRSFYPRVEACLQEAGWPPYCSFGSGIKRTGLWKFLQAMARALRAPREVEALLALGRSRVLQVACGFASGGENYKAEQQWDKVEALYVPERLETLKKLLEKASLKDSSKSPALAVLSAVEEEVALWQKDVAEGLISLIERLRQAGWAGAYQERLLEALAESAHLLSELKVFGQKGQKDPELCPAMDLLLLLVQKHRLFKERGQCALPAEDWLELIYEPASVLALVGVHEGALESQKREDVFLPESLRQSLNLRGRAQREALNFFLMRSLLLAREEEGAGKVGIFLAKTDPQGQPCVPSSLLFYVPEDRLAEQALRLLGEEAGEESPVAYSREKWHLKRVERAPLCSLVSSQASLEGGDGDVKEGDVPEEAMLSLSPSLMKSFLECPRRFFVSSYGKWRSLEFGFTLPSHEIGTFIHELASELSCEAQQLPLADEEALKAHLESRAQALLKQRWKRSHEELSLLVGVQYRYILERLAGLARLHTEALREGWQVVATEEAFSWRPWADLPVNIVLRMDRIEYHAKTGALRVLDIKTKNKKDLKDFSPELQHLSSKLSEEAQALTQRWFPSCSLVIRQTKNKELKLRWKEVQLPLYVLALEKWAQQKGLSVSSFSAGYLSLPLFGSEARCQMWEDLSEEDIWCAFDWCKDVADRLLRGQEEDFPFAEELGWDVPKYSPLNAWAPEGLSKAFEEKRTQES